MLLGLFAEEYIGKNNKMNFIMLFYGRP